MLKIHRLMSYLQRVFESDTFKGTNDQSTDFI